MSDQTRGLVDLIRAKLNRTMKRIALAELLFGVVCALGFLAALFFLAAALEAGLWLGTTPRTFFFWTFIGLVVLGLGAAVAWPLLKLNGRVPGLTEQGTARRIGQTFPDVSDRLVNMLQLADGQRTFAPAPLVDRAVSSLGASLQDVPFEEVERFGGAKRALKAAVVPFVALLLFLLIAPSAFFGATHRLFSPSVAFSRPAPFQLAVTPGSVDLVKGESLAIGVQAVGPERPVEVVLHLNQNNEERIETIQLYADSTGHFRHTLVNVRQPLRYRVSADPVETGWFEANVIDRPLVRGLQAKLTFPGYTRLPPRLLDPNVGDITALPGTRVDLEANIGGQNVAAAFIDFETADSVRMALSGSSATGQFVLSHEDTYQILITNDAGITNADRITYSLNLQQDESPSIALLEPGTSETLTEALNVNLRMRIIDDFGFSSLTLYYRLSESKFGEVSETFESVDLPYFDPNLLDQEVVKPWLLAQSGLDLVQGDVVSYYLEVRDNDTVARFKPAQTPIYELRFPSLAEQYQELDAEQDAVASELEDMVRQAEDVRDQFEELRDEIRRKQDADWEDQRQLERLSEQQKTLDERVEEIQNSVESMVDQMEENNLVSGETLDTFEELQRVMSEINSPELREALEKLQESLQNLDLSQMQQSFQQFEFNEQQYQQRLERVLELFKRLRTEQKLDEAQRRADNLASQEERLAEETERLINETADPESTEESPENPEAENAESDETSEQNNSDPEQGEENQDSEPSESDSSAADTEQNEASEQDSASEQNEASEQEDSAEQNPSEQGESDQPSDPSQPPKSPDELAREQERSKEEMEALEELIKEIQEQMEELSNTPDAQMNDMQQQLQQQNLPQQMQENSQQLQQQQLQKAQEGQQSMQQQLQQLSSQLSDMRQQMSQEQMQINMAGLRHALDDVLTLSLEQESLREEVAPLSPDNPALRQYAQQQVELSDGLTMVSDTLQKLSENIPQMSRRVQQETGDALLSMDRAVSEMSEREVDPASGNQKSSMTHLNNLALLLSDLLDQLMNQASGGAGGQSLQQMMQQLQQMAGQQQQINEQIQQMLNDMVGNRLSVGQQERLQQLAGQQEALRRQLQEMSENDELSNQVLGDLDRIAEQMAETINELRGRQVDRQTTLRQQEILTRLLDAQRSLRERGKTQKRQGEQGRDYAREQPPALPESEQADQLRRDLIRALESGYTPDYENLIKRYFEVLQDQ